MEAGFVALIVLMAILGIAIGWVIGKKKAERKYTQETQHTQGILNVDCGDPEFEPGLFLGLSVPIQEVVKKKYIVLTVNVMTQNSHE
jgi:hypothetical protein